MSQSDSEIEFNVRSSIGQGDELPRRMPHGSQARGIIHDHDYSSAPNEEVYSSAIEEDIQEGDIRESRSRSSSARLDVPRSNPVHRMQSTPLPYSSSSGKAPSIKPDKFSGNDDWEVYISHFEVCAKLGNWSRRDKVLALAASFCGQARLFYMNLPDDEKESYEAVVFRMGRRFGNTHHRNIWLSRFESRNRRPTESLADFGDEILRLSQKAYSNLDMRAQEMLALNQLYREVSPEMKYRCISSGCRSVAEAVEIIDTYESIVGDSLGKERRKMAVRRVDQHQQPSENFTDQESSSVLEVLNKLTERIAQLEGKLNQNGNASKRGVCFLCQSADHYARECPKNNRRGANRRNERRESTSPKYHNRQSGNFNPST